MKSGLRRLRSAASRDLAPVPLSTRMDRTGFVGGLHRSDRESQLHTMAALGDVYAIVSLIASSVSKTNWKLYRKQPPDGRRRYTTSDSGDDQRTEVIRHAALDLWNKPNSFFTQRAFLAGTQQHMELTGEGYWLFNRVSENLPPTAMWYVRPDRMEPVPHPEKFLAGWIYTSPDGEQVPLQTWEVIGPPSLAFPNPWDYYHGLGPVQSVLVDIQAAAYSVQWNRNFFYNNATPGGVIQIPGTLNDPDFDKFTDRWRETHRGITAAGRVGILEGGATWVNAQQSMRDMQFAELRQVSGDTVRRAWRIHKHMLGDVDDVNRANAETAEESFTRWIVSDRLDILRDVANGPFLAMFGAQDDVEFDYQDPVPSNREADNFELTSKVNAAVALVAAGYDPEESLETVGLPAVTWTGIPSVLAAPEPVTEPAVPAIGGQDAEGQPGQGDLAAAALALRKIGNDELREAIDALGHLNGHMAGAR